MALITQQETAILRLTQALFNAAPGAIYLKALNEEVLAGQSFADLAQAIVNSTSFFIENNKHDPFDLFSNQGLVDWSFVIMPLNYFQFNLGVTQTGIEKSGR